MTVIPVLRHEADVEFARIGGGGFRILSAMDAACLVIGEDLWLTSGTDSHSTGQHPLGNAYDLRTKTLDVPTIIRVKSLLETRLGARFTVLYETPTEPRDHMLRRIATINPHATGEHLHAQVRKGTTYPPADGVLEV